MGNLDVKYYLSVFWRRFPYFLVIAAFVSAIGLTVAAILPPVYRSTAVVLVERPQIPGDLAQSTVPINAIEQIQGIQQRMLTRANMLDLADRFDIYANQAGMQTNDIVESMRARITLETDRPTRNGRAIEGATFIRVSFDAASPTLAAEVANDVTTQMLQENVRIRTSRATDTLDFFEQEVDRLSAELDRKNAEILDFKLANQNALPDSLETRRNEQTLKQERLIQMQREEASLRDQRERVVSIFEQTGQVFSNRQKSREEQELESLRRELDQARAVYTASNPRVVMLRNRIAALEPLVKKQLAMINPEYLGMSEIEIQLAQLDARLESITTERERIEQELAALERTIRDTPANEIALNELQRNYANLKAQYDSAVARMSDAAVGERLEVMAKGERFSLVEQAAIPQDPMSPHRLLIGGGSIVAGFGAGLGFIVLLELLNRSIRRPVELGTKLGIEPIASVPYIRTSRETSWKRTIVAVAMALIILAIPAGLLAIHTYYLPLDLLVSNFLLQIF